MKSLGRPMLIDVLEDHQACAAACDWVGTKSLKEAWTTCNNPSWMIWFIDELFFERCLSERLRKQVMIGLSKGRHEAAAQYLGLWSGRHIICDAIRASISHASLARAYRLMYLSDQENML